MFDLEKSKVQQIKILNCSKLSYLVDVKRDDLIDAVVSGNKWRKLKYNMLAIQAQKNQTVITFGGAYSNHLVATAKACSMLGLKSVGIVRGDELNDASNDTLRVCKSYGMKLTYVSREVYYLRGDRSYLEQLHVDYPNSFVIPEGGANFYGLIGCQEIWKELSEEYTDIFIAGGTGTTAAGILSGMKEGMTLHVCSALKGDFLREDIIKKIAFGFHNDDFTQSCENKLRVYSEDLFGGYGKYNQELLNFINWSKKEYNLPLDQVYTGKAFFRMNKMLQAGFFQNNAKIIFIHTGGLQGNTAL